MLCRGTAAEPLMLRPVGCVIGLGGGGFQPLTILIEESQKGFEGVAIYLPWPAMLCALLVHQHSVSLTFSPTVCS